MELLSLNGPEEEQQPSTLEELLEDGLLKLQGKLLKQGASQLHKAMQMDPEKVTRLLTVKFHKSSQASEWEISLALGATLLRSSPTNADLANQLGNCARRIGNYTLANNYYRHALKNKKNHQFAQFNLGASLAYSEKYDQDVKLALQPYMELDGIQLPHYKSNSNFPQEFPEEVQQALGHSPEFTELLKYATQQSSKLEPLEREILFFNLCLFGYHEKDPAAQKAYKLLIERESQLPNIKMLGLLVQNALALHEEEDLLEEFLNALEQEPYNRLLLINIGILYKQQRNWLKAYKYFLKGQELLEKTEGRFEVEEQLILADHFFNKDILDKANILYKEVLLQGENLHASQMQSEIYKMEEEWDLLVDALQPLKKAKSPESEYILEGAWDKLSKMGDKARDENRTFEAFKFYERAVRVLREPETFHSLVQLSQHLKYTEKANRYAEEHKKAIEEKKEKLKENERDDLIQKGKQLLRDKQFAAAISQFKYAWKIKPNHDTFMLLAYLYKNLKQQDELQDLLTEWKAYQAVHPQQEKEN